jgi:hypothetical protein
MKKNKLRIPKMKKAEMIDRNIKTAEYQREIAREHVPCRMDNATATVHFDPTTRSYYVDCSDCKVYSPEDVQ